MMKYTVMFSLIFLMTILNLKAQEAVSGMQKSDFLRNNFETPDSLTTVNQSSSRLNIQTAVFSGEDNGAQARPMIFLAYELGEMAFNKFRNFSGELGLRFQNDHMLRFVYQNVRLSEKHLSSDFARSVDGKHISGLMKSYEVFYDFKIWNIGTRGNVNIGLSTGYAHDYYEHSILKNSVENFSWTLGFAPGYRETDLFKLRGLYFYLAIPFRYYFNPLAETPLGDSTVKRHLLVNNIWFFVGYEF